MRSLPRVVSSIPNDLRTFLEKVREYLSESGENRFVTLGELRKGGIVGTTPGGTITVPTDFAVEDPVVPTNLVATGAFAVIFLEWDTPDYLGHSHTEVWAADTDDFAAKVLVGTTEANSFGHEIGTGATKYYWIRFVNTLGTVGPFNSTAGTAGTTSQDPDYLIEVLSDAYGVTGPAPFFQIDTPTVINGVTIPAGTYIKQAWIADATISRAKIQDLAVDNAKINDLNVSKLTTGVLQVGATISSQGYVAGTSGWRINANGTAEFSSITARGSIFASGGTIGGATIDATGVQSTNYAANSAGWRITGAGDMEVNSLLARGTLLGGAATGYNSGGTGFFAGLDAGTYKWRVGDITTAGSPKYVRWTGNNLEISTGLTDIINTPNVSNNAISVTVAQGVSSSNVAVSDSANPMVTTIGSFTSPAAGKLVVSIVSQYHNFSTGTDYHIQPIADVNGVSSTTEWPIIRLGSRGTNAAFIPIGPSPSTAGNGVSVTQVEVLNVTQGQTVTINAGCSVNANNSVVYLLEAGYTAVLYKK